MGWLESPLLRIPNVTQTLSHKQNSLKTGASYIGGYWIVSLQEQKVDTSYSQQTRPFCTWTWFIWGLAQPRYPCAQGMYWRKGYCGNHCHEQGRGNGLLPSALGSLHQTLLSCKLIYSQDLEQHDNCIKDMLVGCRCCGTDYYLNFCVSRCPVGTFGTHCVGIWICLQQECWMPFTQQKTGTCYCAPF